MKFIYGKFAYLAEWKSGSFTGASIVEATSIEKAIEIVLNAISSKKQIRSTADAECLSEVLSIKKLDANPVLICPDDMSES